VAIWISRTSGTVDGREVRRVFRSQFGDWCAEIVVAHGTKIEVFDYHPSIPALQILRNDGADIQDDVIAQGAEGINVRWRAREEEP
jgi:hypothetical protein